MRRHKTLLIELISSSYYTPDLDGVTSARSSQPSPDTGGSAANVYQKEAG